MKNFKLVIAIVLLIIASTVNVQKVNGQAAIIALLVGDKVASEKFNLSMEVGTNFSDFSNVEFIDGRKLGWNFGIAGNLKLHDNWFLSPNVYFLSQRNGAVSSYSLNTGNPSLDQEYVNKPTELKMNYTDVLVFLSYQTNNKKFRFGMAPQISFLKKSDIIISNDYGDFRQDFKSFTNDIDFGALADIAYILGRAHKGRGIHIHLRYYYGLNDVFNSSLSPNENLNSFFSIHVSLPFITDELAAKNLEVE